VNTIIILISLDAAKPSKAEGKSSSSAIMVLKASVSKKVLLSFEKGRSIIRDGMKI
jgi:hypothetical protein